MFRLSRRVVYAIEAVLDIAWNGTDGPVRSAEITHRQDIPRRYLEHVLQALVRHGLLTGQRGPRGGYVLARAREEISLADIVRVVQDLDTAEDAVDVKLRSDLGTMVVQPVWRDFTRSVFEYLETVSIQDLCDRARDAGVPRASSPAIDYVI